jgi:hypothetical protein
MSEWKEHTRKGKTRLVYQTETHTATVRQAKDGQWLWAVHSRGNQDPRFPTPYMLSHGKCESVEEAKQATVNSGGWVAPITNQPCCVYFMGADSTGKSALVKEKQQ